MTFQAEREIHQGPADWRPFRNCNTSTDWIDRQHEYSSYQASSHGALANDRAVDSPPGLTHLLVVIGEARKILDWEDDWDGEGSPAYEEETLTRARSFLVNNITQLWTKYGLVIEAPRVLPGPDGSIDIHWRTDKHELLLNVPANRNERATYYGKSSSRDVKGNFDLSVDNQWLLLWLAE